MGDLHGTGVRTVRGSSAPPPETFNGSAAMSKARKLLSGGLTEYAARSLLQLFVVAILRKPLGDPALWAEWRGLTVESHTESGDGSSRTGISP